MWVVKLLAALVGAEMDGVLGRQEGALVMIEPPGQPGRGGVLEIYNGVVVTVKHRLLEQLRGAMGQPRIDELRLGADRLAVETREHCGGGRAVKTAIMKEDADLHSKTH